MVMVQSFPNQDVLAEVHRAYLRRCAPTERVEVIVRAQTSDLDRMLAERGTDSITPIELEAHFNKPVSLIVGAVTGVQIGGPNHYHRGSDMHLGQVYASLTPEQILRLADVANDGKVPIKDIVLVEKSG